MSRKGKNGEIGGDTTFKFANKKYCTYVVYNDETEVVEKGIARVISDDTIESIKDTNEKQEIEKLINQEIENIKKDWCNHINFDTISGENRDCNALGYIIDEDFMDNIEILYQINDLKSESLFCKLQIPCSRHDLVDYPPIMSDITIDIDQAKDFMACKGFKPIDNNYTTINNVDCKL